MPGLINALMDETGNPSGHIGFCQIPVAGFREGELPLHRKLKHQAVPIHPERDGSRNEEWIEARLACERIAHGQLPPFAGGLEILERQTL